VGLRKKRKSTEEFEQNNFFYLFSLAGASFINPMIPDTWEQNFFST